MRHVLSAICRRMWGPCSAFFVITDWVNELMLGGHYRPMSPETWQATNDIWRVQRQVAGALDATLYAAALTALWVYAPHVLTRLVALVA